MDRPQNSSQETHTVIIHSQGCIIIFNLKFAVSLNMHVSGLLRALIENQCGQNLQTPIAKFSNISILN